MLVESLPMKNWKKVFLNDSKEVLCYPFENDESAYIRYRITKGIGTESFVDNNWAGNSNPNKILVVNNVRTGVTEVTIDYINIKEIKALQIGYWSSLNVKVYKDETLFDQFTGQTYGPRNFVDVTKIVLTNFSLSNQGLWLYDNRANQPLFYKIKNVLKEKIEQVFYDNELMNQCVLKF